MNAVVYFALIVAVAWPLGAYMARLFTRRKSNAVERAIYRLCGIDETKEQTWSAYTIAMLIFSAVTLFLTYAVERLQHRLPLNPDRLGAVPPDLAWNTAMSFTTNTNWQAYSGESTMSHLTQMAGLTLHNFVSAAVGIVLAIAIIRGVARASAKTIGNFRVDLTRCTLWLLLPISFVSAIVLTSQGVIQNFRATQTVTTLEGKTQKIPQGPVASQEAIKELGTNGGGFFNANSAHPYENPTPFANLFEMFLIFAIPAGLPITLGIMTGKPRHGWAVFAAMAVLFLAAAAICIRAERGNMEGKEVRFGTADSALFATITTDASCGAVNSMHDSFTPIGGSIPLLNIMLGEIVFGGTGAGLYGMFLFIVLAVFIAGLMVGRTPEYLGKKIEAHDVKLAMLAVLILAFCILAGTAVAAVTRAGMSSIANAGPHGLTELTYAFTSATGNNGSAFAGLNANTKFYNVALGIAMFAGRFLMIVPLMGIAGSLAAKKKIAETAGTFPVDGPLFTALLVGVILIVGALTYFPVLSLGPYVEEFLWKAGRVNSGAYMTLARGAPAWPAAETVALTCGSSASSPPPSARSFPRSASPAWTACSSTTSWRCRAAPSKRRAT